MPETFLTWTGVFGRDSAGETVFSLQSETVRGEPRVTWIESMSEEMRVAYESLGEPESDSWNGPAATKRVAERIYREHLRLKALP